MPITDLPCVLNAEKTVVSLALPRALDASAQELEDLILFLAGIRARMQPEVPDPPPAVNERSHLIADASILTGADGNQVILSILHPGIGWFRCRLARGQVQPLLDALTIASAQARDPTKH